MIIQSASIRNSKVNDVVDDYNSVKNFKPRTSQGRQKRQANLDQARTNLVDTFVNAVEKIFG